MKFYKKAKNNYYVYYNTKHKKDDFFKNTPTDRWIGSKFIKRG